MRPGFTVGGGLASLETMKPTKKAIALLRSTFCMQTKQGECVASSHVDTCEGTLPLWGQLHRAGLVSNEGRGVLGHDFAVRLKPEGEALLKSLIRSNS
jgi:hypothetical protein